MGSGYDLSSKNPFRLMKGRLGVYDKRPFEDINHPVEGVSDLAAILRHAGGNRQQERLIADKKRTLERAVWNSYQAAEVVAENAVDRKPKRALINPNKLKQDYDDKIISIDYSAEFHCGDVFEWLGTNTHWLIYLQDLTELAYFRGEIRRCTYEIEWEDEQGNHKTYAAVRGPVETRIDYIQKHGISVDNPNHSLNIMLPKNDLTIARFKRYQKFYLKNDDICWRIEATDAYSTPGILEITAVEYYANETEDDVKHGIVGGLIEPPIDPNEEDNKILGDTFIKVKSENKFKFKGTLAAEWRVDKKYPVSLVVDKKDPRNITVCWNSPYSGQFELYYGDYSKTIVVESLF